MDRRPLVVVSGVGEVTRVLVIHLAVNIDSKQPWLVDCNNSVTILNNTTLGGLPGMDHGLDDGVTVELGDLHIHLTPLLHLEVDIGVAPLVQELAHPRGVAELLVRAFCEEVEGLSSQTSEEEILTCIL